ncbi:MAG: shikimate dehydrogenase [Pirellulales bacterium]|nr:shikimate dehydrogenase [Pirellulales bacterium]
MKASKHASPPPPPPSHAQQDVCCLMGDPVAENPTHYMLEKAFTVANLDWRFLTFEVAAADFEAALRGVRIFEFRGVMLAAPHRGEVHRFLESATDVARLSGQVNCLALKNGELRGHNTEGPALRALAEGSIALKGLRAVVLGCGRTGKSIAAELALAGAASIELVSIQPEQAEPLAAALKGDPQTAEVELKVTPWPEQGGSIRVSEDCRLLVNATPVGRNDSNVALPLDVAALPAEALAVDMVYNPPLTRLLRDGRKRGLKTIDGLTLLVEQAALAFKIWTGRQPDRDAMREAVEEFLVL